MESIAQMWNWRVSETPSRTAFQYPTDSGWESLSWKEADARVRAIACGLRALGIGSEERCAILCSTRVEWILCDLGILCAAGATTTVYPSNTADECAYILKDSSSRVVFAEDADQLAKLVEKRSELKEVFKVVQISGAVSDDLGGWVISLEQLEAMGKEADSADPKAHEAVVKGIKKQQLATLIYTSGTTGRPKGVELTHDCWVFEADGLRDEGILSIEDHQYLWLPLSHSFGKVLEAAQIRIGFATTVDGRIPKLVENLAVIKPTVMAAAPRIFEKVFNKVVSGAKAGGGLKFAIFSWAVKVGREVSQLKQQGREPGGLLALKNAIADKLVFSKLKALFGGRVRFFISGAAPLSREIAEFFHAAGVLIIEGYGLTETSAGTFCNHPDAFKFGSVGRPIGDTQVKIDESDGEILIKGRGVMRGYHNLDQQTAEVFTDDGWFRTGDIGELDAQGFLKITDRKKDLIKTSGGKYVAPQLIEGKLKMLCPYISQVVVHGDKRNFCSALITVDEESIVKWGQDNSIGGNYEQLTKSPQVRQMVEQSVSELNGTLASYETLKKFDILPQDFSVETGELTPSLKVKRKVVETRYQAILDGFYDSAMAQL